MINILLFYALFEALNFILIAVFLIFSFTVFYIKYYEIMHGDFEETYFFKYINFREYNSVKFDRLPLFKKIIVYNICGFWGIYRALKSYSVYKTKDFPRKIINELVG